MQPQDLLDKVRSRDFTLGVVGLGRVGLPLALAYAMRGVRTLGVDLDESRIAAIRAGGMPFQETGGQAALEELKDSDQLDVGTDYGRLRDADAIFITVGTLLNSEFRPDYTHIEQVLNGLAGILRPVQILMLRSTVAPGTLVRRVKPFIENNLQLSVGRDVLLASTPERIAAGKALQELPMLPEIVGGIDNIRSQVAAAVLKTLNEEKTVHITKPEGAELAKLFTNVYRYVTFALANEFALLAEVNGADAHEIIRASNEGYPRGGIPLPGPCGGPCLAKDGYFLVENLTARESDRIAPRPRLDERRESLDGAKVCVLGLGFKAEIDDTRQSPALRIIEMLRSEGANVVVCDPFHETADLESAVEGASAIVLATNHKVYRDLPFLKYIEHADPPPILVDCWGEWDGEKARAANLDLLVFGKGD